MIPAQYIVAWSKLAPWAELAQVEQDLIISRALVELFSDPFLAQELRFRGGTALNKLHFPTPMRYSEDIDLVRTSSGASKPILDHIHDRLDPWLGNPEYFRSRVAPALRYTVQSEDGSARIRLKVEINETEIAIFDKPQTLPFNVNNPWFSGSAEIPTFSNEEILATKLRALLQRNKGRDLIDISHALTVFDTLDEQKTVDVFIAYLGENQIPRWDAERRMFDKLARSDFFADVLPLLAISEQSRFDEKTGKDAFAKVFHAFISRIPGKTWARTEEMLSLHLPDLFRT